MALYAFDGTGHEDTDRSSRDSNVLDFFRAYDGGPKNEDPSLRIGSLYLKGIGNRGRWPTCIVATDVYDRPAAPGATLFPVRLPECERGGTGRRTGLKIPRPQGHVGSTPTARTTLTRCRRYQRSPGCNSGSGCFLTGNFV